MDTDWGLLSAMVAAVPAVLILFAVSIGSKQAREFHKRTGDSSLLVHISALSRFPDDVAKSEAVSAESRENVAEKVAHPV